MKLTWGPAPLFSCPIRSQRPGRVMGGAYRRCVGIGLQRHQEPPPVLLGWRNGETVEPAGEKPLHQHFQHKQGWGRGRAAPPAGRPHSYTSHMNTVSELLTTCVFVCLQSTASPQRWTSTVVTPPTWWRPLTAATWWCTTWRLPSMHWCWRGREKAVRTTH